MDFYITFFLPSILGVFLYSFFVKEKKFIELVINYLLNVLFSNFISIAFILLVNSKMESLIMSVQGSLGFSFKYMALSMVLSVVFAIIMIILKKYFVFSIEVQNGREKSK